MSIVTKTGDKGTTGLFGGGRVPKDGLHMEAIGTVDELNSLLGVILAAGHLSPEGATQILHLQHLLFRLGGDLCTPLDKHSKQKRMEQTDIAEIEQWIAALETALPPQMFFILPGGSHGAALLHVARTVCRRAERCVVRLAATEPINEQARIYLNRLSDYFFLAARMTNHEKNITDVKVQYE